MERTDVLQKVIDTVCETLDADPDVVSEKTTFDDLNADSFDKLELVTGLEDDFGLTLDDEVLERIESISDAVDAIVAAQ